jgi:hypothetical protein
MKTNVWRMASLEATLLLNGHELSAPIDEQEEVFLELASGALGREGVFGVGHEPHCGHLHELE